MYLECLRSDLLSVNHYVKRAQPALASAISASERNRLDGRNLQFIAEPPVASFAKPATLVCALALVVVLAFALGRTCSHKVDGAILDLLAAGFKRRDLRFALLPFEFCVNFPVHGVTGVEHSVERPQGCILRSGESFSSESQWRTRDRFHSSEHVFYFADECWNLDSLDTIQERRVRTILDFLAQTFLPQIAGQHNRAVQHRDHRGIIRHRFNSQAHRESDVDGVAVLPFALAGNIRTGLRIDRLLLAVDGQSDS